MNNISKINSITKADLRSGFGSGTFSSSFLSPIMKYNITAAKLLRKWRNIGTKIELLV
jgi:hypothetical protein